MKFILFLKSRKFWFNILAAIIFLGILIIPMNWFLKILTGYGEIITIPDVRNTSFSEAKINLEELDLLAEVMDSSAYFENFEPGTVVQQYPSSGSLAKAGRKIQLTVNRHRAENIYLPILIERTLKRAVIDIKSKGLRLGKIIYKPDLAEGIVLGVMTNGELLNAGDLIRKGTTIDFIVGEISGPPTQAVPNLLFMSLKDAIKIIGKSDLQIQVVKGNYLDSNNIIIDQNPMGSEGILSLHSGAIVRVWLENNSQN
jgi:beta-lactam-binding protein with PASTA domain